MKKHNYIYIHAYTHGYYIHMYIYIYRCTSRDRETQVDRVNADVYMYVWVKKHILIYTYISIPCILMMRVVKEADLPNQDHWKTTWGFFVFLLVYNPEGGMDGTLAGPQGSMDWTRDYGKPCAGQGPQLQAAPPPERSCAGDPCPRPLLRAPLPP